MRGLVIGADTARARNVFMSSSVMAASTPAVTRHPAQTALSLGALGVVFGYIGTSPINAFR